MLDCGLVWKFQRACRHSSFSKRLTGVLIFKNCFLSGNWQNWVHFVPGHRHSYHWSPWHSHRQWHDKFGPCSSFQWVYIFCCLKSFLLVWEGKTNEGKKAAKCTMLGLEDFSPDSERYCVWLQHLQCKRNGETKPLKNVKTVFQVGQQEVDVLTIMWEGWGWGRMTTPFPRTYTEPK